MVTYYMLAVKSINREMTIGETKRQMDCLGAKHRTKAPPEIISHAQQRAEEKEER